MNISNKYLTVASLVLVLIVSACNQVSPPQPPAEKVTLQLKWVHQAQFAGFYVAKDLGMYQQHDLEVDLVAAGPKIKPLQNLVEGKADFAITSAEDVIKYRSEGRPVVAIAAIYRLNPHIFMTMPDSGITDPRQFPGHSISYSSKDGKLQAVSMFNNLSLDMDTLTEKKYDYKYQNLINGEVDIATGYMTGGYLRLQKLGFKMNVIWPEDYGVHVYGDVLVTTESTLQQKPELVRSFLSASFEGWRRALADQNQGVDSTMKFALEADRDLQKEMLSQSFPLIETGEDRLGWMNATVWNEIVESLSSSGAINKDNLKGKLFDMEMLKQAYEPIL